MEVSVLKFEEAPASSYPQLFTYDSEGVQDEEPLAIERPLWDRIESYIAYRWTPRQCVWTVCGPGDWLPHLGPLSNVTVDLWDDESYTWGAVTSEPTAVGGFYIPSDRTYRITGTVGDTPDDVPQLLVEAYTRLEAYHSDMYETAPGSSSHRTSIPWEEEVTRSPTWIARAMQHSGAADLLRAYRRV